MAEEKKEYAPEHKFSVGEKLWLKFRFEKPSRPIKGKFGEFYNWGIEKWVNDHWEDYIIKPTEKLRLLLLNIPVKKELQYVIVKSKDVEGDFDYFEVWRRDEEPEPNVHNTKDIITEEKGAKEPPPEDESKAPPLPQKTESTDPVEVMRFCVVTVCEIVEKEGEKYPKAPIGDCARMIDTLFIEMMKRMR